MVNLNQGTITRIARAIHLVVGGEDWILREEMLARLKFAGIGCSESQFYNDLALIKECRVPGFNYFLRDSGFDKSTATILTVFRWFAKNRSRGQATVHLHEAINLLKEREEYGIGCKQRDRSSNEPIEVESIVIEREIQARRNN